MLLGRGPYSAATPITTEKNPPKEAPRNSDISIAGNIVTATWDSIMSQTQDEADLKGYLVS